MCFCTSKLNFLCALKMFLVRKYTVFREELCCPGEKERMWKICVCVCVCVHELSPRVSVSHLWQSTSMDLEGQKYKLCFLFSSLFQQLSLSHVITEKQCISLSHCVSLCFSNWCAASTHQLSGAGPIAELRASQLLSRQANATRTQSDIQNPPEGSATAARWRRGQSGSNAGPAPPSSAAPSS